MDAIKTRLARARQFKIGNLQNIFLWKFPSEFWYRPKSWGGHFPSGRKKAFIAYPATGRG
jgi:hypothetical protein